MPLPPLDSLPSETTVSEAANRMILSKISDLSAWVICPSNIKENELGYDASFEGTDTKIAVIQYKRRYTGSGGSADARITVEQHATIRRVYPRPGVVYYAWGDFASYRELGEAHRLGTVLRRMIFVDSNDFPVGTTRLRHEGGDELLALHPDHPPLEVPFRNGEAWADSLVSCQVGVQFKDLKPIDGPSSTSGPGGPLGQTRYLIWERA